MSARDIDHVVIQRARDAARAHMLPVYAFSQLKFRERRRIAHLARWAHPLNGAHRRRFIEARLWLDTYGIEPHCKVGCGVGQRAPLHELSRWEKAARAVC